MGVGGHSSCQTRSGYRSRGATPPLPLNARAASLLNRSIMHHRFKSWTRHPQDAGRAECSPFSGSPVTAKASQTQTQTSEATTHLLKKPSPSDNKRRHNTTIQLMRLLHLCAERPQHGAPVEASRRSARDG